MQAALDPIQENRGRWPEPIWVEGGYTTGQNILDTAAQPTELIGWLGKDRSKSKLERRGVSPQFMPEHFKFNAQQNCYTCPEGKILSYQTSQKQVGATEKHYQAQASDCPACSAKDVGHAQLPHG